MQKILNYINEKLIEPIKGNYLDNFDPSNSKVYSLIPDSDEGEIKLAIK